MRNAGRLKLGYYPLPIEEARNLRQRLIAPQSFFAVDPCAGDGAALVEITRDLPAQQAAIELDSDRAAAAAARGIAVTHGSTFESHFPAGSCSLIYLNPPYDVEMRRHNNQRMELVFLDHCYGWLKSAGVLILIIPEVALSHCAKRLASQFERISVFRLGHPESVRFHQLAVIGIRKPEHKRGDTRAVDQLLRLAYVPDRLPILGLDTAERYAVPASKAVPVQYRGLPLDEIEDALARSSATQSALNLLTRKPESITGRPVTPLHGGHVGLLCTAGMLNGVFGEGRERHIAHWRSVKHVDVYHEEEDGYQIVRRRERFSHELTLAYQTGRVVVLKEAEQEEKSNEECT
jgi:hypothetical protein